MAAMESADVPNALESEMLALDGTIERQKQRLFDSFLHKWKERVYASYTPKVLATKEKFSAAVDSAVGVLTADWNSLADPKDAPSNTAGEGAKIESDTGPGANDGPAAVSASLRGMLLGPRPAVLRHSLQASKRVVYYDPLFTSGLQGGDHHMTITAICTLGADGSGGTGGVRVGMQTEAGEKVGVARYTEVCLADGA